MPPCASVMSAAMVAVPSPLPVTMTPMPEPSALATAGFCDTAVTVIRSPFGSTALIGTVIVSPTVSRCSPTGSTAGGSFGAVTATGTLTTTGGFTLSDTDSVRLTCPAPLARIRSSASLGISTLATAAFSLIASTLSVSPSASLVVNSTSTTSPTIIDCASMALTAGGTLAAPTVTGNATTAGRFIAALARSVTVTDPACWARRRSNPGEGISALTTLGSDDSAVTVSVSLSGSDALYSTSSTSPAVIACAPIASTTGGRFGWRTVTSNVV